MSEEPKKQQAEEEPDVVKDLKRLIREAQIRHESQIRHVDNDVLWAQQEAGK